MRVIALGLALGVAVACTSGLESANIARDLADKGKDAIAEADGLTMMQRPEAAQIILRRHVKDIDEAIDKVTKNERINDRDKTEMLQELQVYRRHFVEISKSSVDKMNDTDEMEWRIRQETPSIW